MTKFDKSKFNYHGGYLTYDGKFVARFKYRSSPIKMGPFKSFLIKNFTVEEYFGIYNEGRGPAPLQILEAKGFTWMTPALQARLDEMKKVYA